MSLQVSAFNSVPHVAAVPAMMPPAPPGAGGGGPGPGPILLSNYPNFTFSGGDSSSSASVLNSLLLFGSTTMTTGATTGPEHIVTQSQSSSTVAPSDSNNYRAIENMIFYNPFDIGSGEETGGVAAGGASSSSGVDELVPNWALILTTIILALTVTIGIPLNGAHVLIFMKFKKMRHLVNLMLILDCISHIILIFTAVPIQLIGEWNHLPFYTKFQTLMASTTSAAPSPTTTAGPSWIDLNLVLVLVQRLTTNFVNLIGVSFIVSIAILRYRCVCMSKRISWQKNDPLASLRGLKWALANILIAFGVVAIQSWICYNISQSDHAGRSGSPAAAGGGGGEEDQPYSESSTTAESVVSIDPIIAGSGASNINMRNLEFNVYLAKVALIVLMLATAVFCYTRVVQRVWQNTRNHELKKDLANLKKRRRSHHLRTYIHSCVQVVLVTFTIIPHLVEEGLTIQLNQRLYDARASSPAAAGTTDPTTTSGMDEDQSESPLLLLLPKIEHYMLLRLFCVTLNYALLILGTPCTYIASCPKFSEEFVGILCKLGLHNYLSQHPKSAHFKYHYPGGRRNSCLANSSVHHHHHHRENSRHGRGHGGHNNCNNNNNNNNNNNGHGGRDPGRSPVHLGDMMLHGGGSGSRRGLRSTSTAAGGADNGRSNTCSEIISTTGSPSYYYTESSSSRRSSSCKLSRKKSVLFYDGNRTTVSTATTTAAAAAAGAASPRIGERGPAAAALSDLPAAMTTNSTTTPMAGIHSNSINHNNNIVFANGYQCKRNLTRRQSCPIREAVHNNYMVVDEIGVGGGVTVSSGGRTTSPYSKVSIAILNTCNGVSSSTGGGTARRISVATTDSSFSSSSRRQGWNPAELLLERVNL